MELTLTERLQKVIKLTQKLRDLGFVKDLSGLKEFSQKTNKFVKDGIPYTGSIKFVENPEITLYLTLSPNSDEICSVEFN
jgi:hypothetical protein